jgi:tetratricopeptide (TPR) repeat protein
LIAASPDDGSFLARRGYVLSKLGEWERAIADYSKAIDRGPTGVLWTRRGDAFAKLGRWSDAVFDYDKAIVAVPADSSLWYKRSIFRLHAGDLEGYRGDCSAMLKRFGSRSSPYEANSLAWYCALLPKIVEDPMQVVTLAEKAVASEPNTSFLNTLGAALYRAGRFEEAVKNLEKAISIEGNGGTAFDSLFLAMARYEQGQKKEAEGWLQRATDWIKLAEAGKADDPSRTGPLDADERLQLDLLRREAATLLGHEPP